jgi:transcriptional regulator with XRE-family HTH domain
LEAGFRPWARFESQLSLRVNRKLPARLETLLSILGDMIDAARLDERMKEKKLSKSEMARRVGVTPPAIRDLVNGNSYSSRHLHKIARELGTTPAYLSGETDDPDSDVPDQPALDRDQLHLIESFDRLSAEDRAALLQIAHSMAGKGDKPTVHSPKLGYRAEAAGRR